MTHLSSLKRNRKVLPVVMLFFLWITFGYSLKSQVVNPVHWSFSVEKQKDNTCNLIFKAKIDDKWHLYSQFIPDGGPVATSFKINQTKAFSLLGKVKEISKAEEKYDASFEMKLILFSEEAVFVQKIKPLTDKAFKVTGELEFMCCDDSHCLPPRTDDFSFDISAIPLEQKAVNNTNSAKDQNLSVNITPKNTEGQKDTIKTASNIQVKDTEVKNAPGVTPVSKTAESKDGSLLAFFFLAFLGGIVGLFTPCVYPMIPMTVSFFMQGNSGRSAGIVKALVFGVSIILIYTLLGVVIMFTRSGADVVTVVSSNWIINLVFFLLFLTFAASFFGMFEIVLPGSLANKVDQQVDKGGLIGAFFMALTLVIVSFSCTGPIVGAILVEASKGFAIKPVIGMLGFSLAFAIPFIIFAASPSLLKKMAKSGSWLNSVKVVFAFILLAFSLKFLLAIDTTNHWNILTREVFLSIWIVLFSLLGFYFLGKIKFAHDSELKHVSFPRFMLAVATFSFVVYLIPGLLGAPLKSIASMLPPPSENTSFNGTSGSKTFEKRGILCSEPKYSDIFKLPYGLLGYFDLRQGLECANQKDKPVFLDIKGHTCSNCKKMEAEVWSDPRVQAKLAENFVIVALYTDDKTTLPENERVTSTYDGKIKVTIGAKNLDYEISKFGSNTQPLYAVLNGDGNLCGNTMGLDTDVEKFLKFLDDGIKTFQAGKSK